ncbi:hypothetical protein CK623_09405 [Vandammella animalimorsus]|uniref:HipA-like kinase domain-containing protein n=1 Tax=Vandammella animalimorsus TaxID=2029117 RepID=A0A2A2APE5_9BURK|nr:HipA family kinase [Vandammella animalimorsus]PAT39574.1 hypothetical protein CK623_09405 [Vandammella animalimorsus]
MKPATVTEVVYRAEQGKTRPYLCQADDGLRYFVKHRSLPRRELVAEWLAAWLARALGLPIAPFRLIEIPDALAGLPWLRELGPGVGFGSALQPAREFSLHDVRRLPSGLAARVAAFDWWVRNSDRSLSAHGGNPNLLWRTAAHAEGGSLLMIDHNLAFERDFSRDAFLSTHVFAEAFAALRRDEAARERMRADFAAALNSLPAALDAIPKAWYFTDPEETLAACWTRDEFVQILARCRHPQTFWSA